MAEFKGTPHVAMLLTSLNIIFELGRLQAF